MGNWIRIGAHYINLDQIVDIITDETRINWQTYREGDKPEPAAIFVRPVTQIDEYKTGGSEEIKFFGAARDAILDWLASETLPPAADINLANLQEKSVA